MLERRNRFTNYILKQKQIYKNKQNKVQMLVKNLNNKKSYNNTKHNTNMN